MSDLMDGLHDAQDEIIRLREENAALHRSCGDWEGELRIHRETETAEVSRLREENARLRDALAHICEYWNRAETDESMSDALWHMIETAADAIDAAREVK